MREAHAREAAVAAGRDRAFEVEWLRTHRAVDDVRGEWESFTRTEAAPHSIFQAPAFVCLDLAATRGSSSPVAVIGRREGRIRWVAAGTVSRGPFTLRMGRVRSVRVPVRTLTLFGDGLVAASDEDQQACYQSLFDALAPSVTGGDVGFDLLHLRRVNPHGPLWAPFRDSSGAVAAGRTLGLRLIRPSPVSQRRFTLRLPASLDQFVASLSKNERRNFHRKPKKLHQAYGDVGLRRYRGPDDVAMLGAAMRAVYEKSWQGRDPAIQPIDTTALLHEAVAARRGWLRSYVLFCRDRPVAFQLGYQYRGTYHAVRTAFDGAEAAHSPGAALTRLLLEDLFADDLPDTLDWGPGAEDYKRALSNLVTEVCEAYLTVTLRARLLLNTQHVLHSVWGQLRRICAETPMTP